VVVSGSVNQRKTHGSRPKPASTVVLVKEGDRALQVCLLKRSSGSDFMPGHYVFPGGTVDEEDKDSLWEDHSDPDVAQWIRAQGRNMAKADILPHTIAAVRETFEEAGILLLQGDRQREEELQPLLDRRSRGELGAGWLKEWVVSKDYRVVLSSLYPWAHWVTPRLRSKRFDTRFFLAVVPRETSCIPDGRETVKGVWMEPREALSSNLTGHVPLSPPTLVTLHELLGHLDLGSLERGLDTQTWGAPRCPRLVSASEGVLLLLPWDRGYEDEASSEPASAGEVLPVGEPFSRMWLHGGIWRPVAI